MKFSELREANLSKAQIKKVHDKADDLPKNDFIKRYGKEGDSVRFATATKMVKKELGIEDYEEGFKSDAQRKAAFASGYKEKDKKKDEMFSTRSLGLKGASKRSRDKAREKDKDSEKSKKKEEVEITEAVSDAYVKQIARMTDRNDHFGARFELARLMKDKQLMGFYDSLEKMHTTLPRGVIGNDAITIRQRLERLLRDRLKSKLKVDADKLIDAL
jgi:hypothetical protein